MFVSTFDDITVSTFHIDFSLASINKMYMTFILKVLGKQNNSY